MPGCPILATFLFLSQGWESTNSSQPDHGHKPGTEHQECGPPGASEESLRALQRRQNLRRQLAHAARAQRQDQVALARFGATAAIGGGKIRREFTCGPSIRSASRSAVTPGIGSSLAA